MSILYFIAALAAYIVKGMSGFANTLVLSTILSFQANNLNITPLDLVLSLPSNLALAWKDRAKLNLRVCAPMALCAILGALPGAFLLKLGDAAILKIAMGALIALVGVETALRGRASGNAKGNTVVMIIIGLISGVMSGIFGIGALMVAYINRCSGSNSEFRGNTCFVFAADNVFRLILYIATGVMTLEAVLHGLCLMPCMIIGLIIGTRLADKIGEQRARTATSLLLILSGLSVVLTNLLPLL